MVDTTNLVAYWKLDENAANTTVTDAHASEDGTASKNTSNFYSASGKINSCFDFNSATPDYVTLPTTTYASTASDWSISFWFNADTMSSDERIFSLKTDNNIDIRFTASSSIGATFGGDGNKFTAKSSLSLSTWYHVVLTWDASATTCKFYVNGVEEDSRTPTSGSSSANNYMGGDQVQTASKSFDGKLDEVGIWSEVLSSTSVGELYNSGSGLAYPFSSDVTITPTTLTLSTTAEEPEIFIKETVNTLSLTTTLYTPEPPSPSGSPSSTITVGSGTVGTFAVATRYPVTEGLIAGTTKQTRNPNLEPIEKGSF